MARLALIGGHSILDEDPIAGFEPRTVATASGSVDLHERGDLVLLQRHGRGEYSTAAGIDHARNLAALVEAGCERILAIGSVGSLHRELAVGAFVCPDDFIALHLGLSLSTDHGGELVPGFHAGWRGEVIASWERLAEPDLRNGGTYWQAIGPRFETPAEIRMIAAHADVIGMTIASECILAGELEIPYAAICAVDNLANGVAEKRLSVAEFEAGKAQNRERLVAAMGAVAADLAAAGSPETA